MKSFLASIALLAFAGPAFAADTLTLTIVSDGTYSGTLSKTWTFSKADMNTFQAFLLANYPATCSPQPCTPPANTVPQAALAWSGVIVGGIVSSVQSWQTSVATTAAAATVVPVNPQ